MSIFLYAFLLVGGTAGSLFVLPTGYSYATIPLKTHKKGIIKTTNAPLSVSPGKPLDMTKSLLEKAIAIRELSLERYSNSLRSTEILSRPAYANLMREIINARQGLAALEIDVNSAKTVDDILDVPVQIHEYGVYVSIKKQVRLYDSAVSIHKNLSRLINLESTVEAAIAALVVSKPDLASIQSTYLNFSNNLTITEQDINGMLNTVAGINTTLLTVTVSQISLSNQLIGSASTHLTIAKKEIHSILSAISTESINLNTHVADIHAKQ